VADTALAGAASVVYRHAVRLWVAYRESGWLARTLWLVAILALGSIAMSAYMLSALWRLPANASVERLLLRHPA